MVLCVSDVDTIEQVLVLRVKIDGKRVAWSARPYKGIVAKCRIEGTGCVWPDISCSCQGTSATSNTASDCWVLTLLCSSTISLNRKGYARRVVACCQPIGVALMINGNRERPALVVAWNVMLVASVGMMLVNDCNHHLIFNILVCSWCKVYLKSTHVQRTIVTIVSERWKETRQTAAPNWSPTIRYRWFYYAILHVF